MKKAFQTICVLSFVFGLGSVVMAEQGVLTLRSYSPATLPTVSTIIDIPDLNDQLEVSRQATIFSLSSDGWDLAAYGGWSIHDTPPKWSAEQYSVGIPGPNAAMYNSLGYELNQEALNLGPAYILVFHTDLWAERLSHEIGESTDNYGVISGCMGGNWSQCEIADWGEFSVTPEPATLSLLALGGLAIVRRQKHGMCK